MVLELHLSTLLLFNPSLPPSLPLSLSPLQFSLFSEVRGLVTPQDLEHFDALVLRREIQALKARQGSSGAAALQQDSLSMVSYPDTLTSSSASCVTNTTLSSARVGPPLLALLAAFHFLYFGRINSPSCS